MYKQSDISSKYTSECRIIDLRSDAVSQPTERMRVAMANAVVGDDVLNDDPTVQELERKCAELFGKEAALFVPTGVMGNLISIMVHCRYYITIFQYVHLKNIGLITQL